MMINFNEIKTPKVLNLLVAFCDPSNFIHGANSDKLKPVDFFNRVSEYCETTGDIIESAGGKVVKFLGDESMVVFEDSKVDDGVKALLKLKKGFDGFFNQESRLRVKMHFGPITVGRLGTRAEKHFDILGDTINYATRVVSHGFAMTPEVFRKLKPATRKLFKKHTPPVRYIPVEESHRD